jgi:hypothetical protein
MAALPASNWYKLHERCQQAPSSAEGTPKELKARLTARVI